MTRYAILFPGQGSQSKGMLAKIARGYPVIKDTYDEASEHLSYDLWHLVQHDPDSQLHQTVYTQVAILVANVALWRCWLACQLPPPVACAGHSLGEYACLIAARVLSFIEVLDLVVLRGRLMQQAVPIGQGGMAAVIGLEAHAVVRICQQAATADAPVSAANFNTPQQTVIAGQTAALQRAVLLMQQHGAQRVVPLPISVPSHCILMKSAAEELAVSLRALPFHAPKIPIYQNVAATHYLEPDDIREALIRQLTHPVQWVNTIQALVFEQSSSCFVECGPGRVLQGLNKRIVADVPTVTTCQPDLWTAAVQKIDEA